MTLEALCNIHVAVVKAFATVKDADMNPVQTVGAALRTVHCRFVPMKRQQQIKYDQKGLKEAYTVLFTTDPTLDLDSALAWNSKTYRVLGYTNSSEMDWLWMVDVVHMPQMDN